MNTDKKYILCPDVIRSKTDGDDHYINARQLSQLYGVRMEQCLIGDCTGYVHGLTKKQHEQLTKLRPSYNGNYSL